MADSPAEPKVPEPGFRRMGPEKPDSPIVISVPHAGRAYSADLLKASRLSRAKLETLEDRLVDRLVWRAVADGAVAIVADVPRAEIDLNRDEREIDPNMIVPMPRSSAVIQSPRSRGGLGLIPTRIAGSGAIWRQRIQAGEMERRIEQVHRPYHAAVAEALDQARARFGAAVLIDCHSMPPRAETGAEARIILGDRHGTSIAPELAETAEQAVSEAGFGVARNAPYAGGHITARHGRPSEGIHALQIEIDRSFYLDVELREPGPDFDRVARLIAAVAKALAARAQEAPQAIAAE
jgi:N-formylglutamate amidohydrolase